MERLTIDGGEVWLGFARNRVKAFKRAGIRYTRQVFDMPDGARIIVELAGKDHTIRLSKTETEWVRAAMPNVRVPEIVEPNEEEYKELAPAQVRRGWIESADSAVDYDDVANSVFGVNAYNSTFIKRTRTHRKNKPGVLYPSTTMFPGVYSDSIYEFNIITNDRKMPVRWETSSLEEERSEWPQIPQDASTGGLQRGIPFTTSKSIKNARSYSACFNINISKRSVISEVVNDGESGQVTVGSLAAINNDYEWKALWIDTYTDRSGFLGKSKIIFRFAAPPTEEGEGSKYFEIESSELSFFVGQTNFVGETLWGGIAMDLVQHIERSNSPLCESPENRLPKNRSITTDKEIFLLRETNSQKAGFATSGYRYIHYGYRTEYKHDGTPYQVWLWRWDYVFEPQPAVVLKGYTLEVINIEKPSERFIVKSPQALGNNGFVMAVITAKKGEDQNIYVAYAHNNDPVNLLDDRGNRETPETYTYKLDRYLKTKEGLMLATTVVVGNFDIPAANDGRLLLDQAPNFLGAFFATERFIWTDYHLYDLTENRFLPLPYICGHGYNSTYLSSHAYFRFTAPPNVLGTVGFERWEPYMNPQNRFWEKHCGDNPWETQSSYIFISSTGRKAKYVHCMTGKIVSYKVVLGEKGALQEIKIEKVEDFGPGTGVISDDGDEGADALSIDFKKDKSKR